MISKRNKALVTFLFSYERPSGVFTFPMLVNEFTISPLFCNILSPHFVGGIISLHAPFLLYAFSTDTDRYHLIFL